MDTQTEPSTQPAAAPPSARSDGNPPETTAPKRLAVWRWFLVLIWPWFLVLVAVTAGVLLWRQLWKHEGAGRPMGGPPAQAAQSVAVATVSKGDIPITLTSLGTVTSLATVTVTVKPQISGYLTAVTFREGRMVKKGDQLAQVDPRPYEVTLAQYQGQLEKDQALLENARRDLERYRRLIKQDSTSQQTVDTAATTVSEYEGTVRADQAQVDAEQLNLSYCRIVSPIDRRVGLSQVDAGNYVTASDSDGIVVVTQLDPISVIFTLAEDDLRRVMRRLATSARLPVAAYDRTGTEKLTTGVLETVDNEIDTSTGTVRLRATFENADGALLPNQFVNVSMLLDTLRGALTVPIAAVQTGRPGTYVYRLSADDTVSLRKVSAGPSADGRTAVLSGLEAGDQVVVDGADHLADVEYATIQVETFYPGASPDVMTSAVTAPLETQLGQMSGLRQMSSRSSGGASVITLQFDASVAMDVAEQEVQAAINAANNLLPDDLPAPPVYAKVNRADAPVLTLAVTSPTLPHHRPPHAGRQPSGTEDIAALRRRARDAERRPEAGDPDAREQPCVGRLRSQHRRSAHDPRPHQRQHAQGHARRAQAVLHDRRERPDPGSGRLSRCGDRLQERATT